MQSPTMIAGLHRIATCTWLHFVALPQRVPALGHRLRGQTVMSVIDSEPPGRRGCNIGAVSRSRTGESIRLRATMPARTDTHDCCPTREHRSRNTFEFRLRRPRQSFKPVRAHRASPVENSHSAGPRPRGWAAASVAPRRGQRGGRGRAFSTALRSGSGSDSASALASSASAACASNTAARRPRKRCIANGPSGAGSNGGRK